MIDETLADLTVMLLADHGTLPRCVRGRLDLMDWLHYRARRVLRRQRQVVRSNEIEAQRAAYSAIDEIATRLVLGLHVFPSGVLVACVRPRERRAALGSAARRDSPPSRVAGVSLRSHLSLRRRDTDGEAFLANLPMATDISVSLATRSMLGKHS